MMLFLALDVLKRTYDMPAIQPSLRDLGNAKLAPALKRRAIFTMSRRDKAMAELAPPRISCNTNSGSNVYDFMNRTLAQTACRRAPFFELSHSSGFRIMTATWTALVMAWMAVSVQAVTSGVSSSRVFNIREFGAAGDRTTLNTPAIQQAIEARATEFGRRPVIEFD